MTKNEALHAMIDGKKVTCDEWGKSSFVSWHNETSDIRSHDGYVHLMQFDRDWKLYKEPKMIDKVEVVYYRNDHGSIYPVIKGSSCHGSYSAYDKYTEVTI